jgi:hypothetical protein
LLDRLHRINRETPDQLYQLRKWSNRAVHAEAGVLDEETQKALAGCALEVVCDLLETAFRYKYVGDAVPAYMSITSKNATKHVKCDCARFPILSETTIGRQVSF